MTSTLTRPHDAAPAERPSAWERARRIDPEHPLASWGASLGVAALALFLRLYHLGTPHKFEFDETYYAKDAWSLLHHGYVLNYKDDANKQLLAGHLMDQWKDTAWSSTPSSGSG